MSKIWIEYTLRQTMLLVRESGQALGQFRHRAASGIKINTLDITTVTESPIPEMTTIEYSIFHLTPDPNIPSEPLSCKHFKMICQGREHMSVMMVMAVGCFVYVANIGGNAG
jgi:hypothetical protein